MQVTVTLRDTPEEYKGRSSALLESDCHLTDSQEIMKDQENPFNFCEILLFQFGGCRNDNT
jgi:hypothetical protein